MVIKFFFFRTVTISVETLSHFFDSAIGRIELLIREQIDRVRMEANYANSPVMVLLTGINIIEYFTYFNYIGLVKIRLYFHQIL